MDLRELTPRELTLLPLVCQGLTDAAIAGRLGIKEGTVNNQLNELRKKLNVRSRVSLAALYTQVIFADRVADILEKSGTSIVGVDSDPGRVAHWLRGVARMPPAKDRDDGTPGPFEVDSA